MQLKNLFERLICYFSKTSGSYHFRDLEVFVESMLNALFYQNRLPLVKILLVMGELIENLVFPHESNSCIK